MKRFFNPFIGVALLFIATPFNPAFSLTISHDTTWSGSITLNQDVIIIDSSTLTISAGSSIFFAEGVSIKGGANCHILVQGTTANKVVFRSSVPDTYWGALNVRGPGASVEVYFADIQSGQVLAYDTSTMIIQDSYLHDYLKLPTKNIAYAGNATYATLQRCHISNYWQVNFYNTPVLIENCLLEFIAEDGIDLDNSPSALIRNCTIRNGLCEKGKIHSVDALDFGKFDINGIGSSADVQNCLIYNITDKGVSAGEKCRRVTVTNSVFYNCGSGATIKDSSLAEIINNTIVNCEYGIECIEKNSGMGGGHASGYNNIIWNNGIPVYLDSDGTLSLAYSDISFNGIFPGTGNINSYPLFVDTNSLNYRLLPGSPCIGTGSAGADMGALYPVGGIAIPVDYLALGIPHSSEIVKGDSLYTIYWIAGDSIHFVHLEFSPDNGGTWTSVAANINASTGTYLWTVPDIYSTKCLIRLSDADNLSNNSTQNPPFSIIPQGEKSFPPVFSRQAGYYANAFSLVMNAEPGAKIYYTLDGSDPTDQSLEYNSPISIEQQYIDTGYQEQNITATNPPHFPISSIRTAPTSQIGPNPALWYKPTGKIALIKVVKARTYVPGKGLGDVFTNSYLIDENGLLNPGGLPVISLATNKENFFDYYSGIYIPGYSFTGYSFTGNYEMSGKESERPVHFEYFEPQSPRILSTNIGARVRGEWIRSLGEKALSLFARSDYDSTNYFNYEFFKGYKRTFNGGSMNQFKRLILRNDGNSWGWYQTTMLKDGTIQSLFDHLNLKYQAYRPSIVFLDGEYWGIHNMRELPDADNLGLTYNLNPDHISIVEHNLDGHNQLAAGDPNAINEYINLRDYINQQDLNIPAKYDYVKSKMDIVNFVDYWVSTIYTEKENFDHNIGCWKVSGNSIYPNAPYGMDGKWRWFAYDFDASFLIPSNSILNLINWLDPDNDMLIDGLFRCDDFRNYFILRAQDVLNSSFKPSRVVSRINQNRNIIEPEMNRHLRRWGNPSSLVFWQQGIDSIINFAQQRVPYVFNEMKTYFSLSDYSQLTLNVDDTVMGKITVNTIRIDKNLPGVNAAYYPWTGQYFNYIPMKLIANPEPGYRFVKWMESGETADTLSVSIAGDSMFTALFEPDPDWQPVSIPHIYINELVATNHSVVDNHGGYPDWIELYNPSDSVVDLAGWYLSDDPTFLDKHRFVSSDSTKISAHGFILLYADNELSQGSTHLSFKLSSGGDYIILTAPDAQTIIDSVNFGFQVADTSWGRYPDGSPTWEFFNITTPGSSNIHIDITEIPSVAGLQVYPNPLSTDVLHFSRAINFRLFNEIGQEILSGKNAVEVNASSLQKGIYFIRTDEGITVRLIKIS